MGTVPSWCCLGSERGVTVMAAVVVIAELGWAVQLVAWVSIPGAVREGGDAPAVGRNGSSQMWVLTGRSVFLGTGQQQEKRFISGIIGINDVELAGQKKKMRKGGCALPGAGFWEGGAELEHGGGDAVAASGRWGGGQRWVTALSMALTLSVPRSPQGRMKLLGAVLLAAGLLGTAAGGDQHPWPDEPSRTCFFQMLSSTDREFCR